MASDDYPYGDQWLYGSNGYKGGSDATELHYYSLKKTFPIKDMTGDFDDDLHLEGRFLDQCYFQGNDLENYLFPDKATEGYGMLPAYERVFDLDATGSTAYRQSRVIDKFQDLINKDQKLNPANYIDIAQTYGYDSTIYEGIHDMFVIHNDSSKASHFPHRLWSRGHAWTWYMDSTGSALDIDQTNLISAIIPKAPAFTKVVFEFTTVETYNYFLPLVTYDSSSVLYASNNMTDWYPMGPMPNMGANAVAGAGSLVAYNSSMNLYFTKDDGRNWNAIGATCGGYLEYRGGMFFAEFLTGSNYNMYSSPDGETWTSTGLVRVDYGCQKILYRGSKYLCYYSKPSPDLYLYVRESTDGVTFAAEQQVTGWSLAVPVSEIMTSYLECTEEGVLWHHWRNIDSWWYTSQDNVAFTLHTITLHSGPTGDLMTSVYDPSIYNNVVTGFHTDTTGWGPNVWEFYTYPAHVPTNDFIVYPVSASIESNPSMLIYISGTYYTRGKWPYDSIYSSSLLTTWSQITTSGIPSGSTIKKILDKTV